MIDLNKKQSVKFDKGRVWHSFFKMDKYLRTTCWKHSFYPHWEGSGVTISNTMTPTCKGCLAKGTNNVSGTN